jgi:hypothetical protein
MKKEVITAVVVGLIIGLIVTLGISTANQALEKQKQAKLSQKTSGPLPSGQLTGQKTLAVTSPEPFDLFSESELVLSGIAWPEAVVSLLSEDQTLMAQADKDGVFTFRLSLIKGYNELTLIAADETGAVATQNLVLTYSASVIQSLKLVSSAYAQEEATSSVKDKIKERLEKTAEEGVDKIKEEMISQSKLPRKKAYVGAIKNINDTLMTLEYKNQDYTVYLSKKENYAAGDQVLTLGYFYPDKNQFTAKKIVKISPSEPPASRQLIAGRIEEIDLSKITVSGKKLTIARKTKLQIKDVDKPAVDDLRLNDYLFAIVVFDERGTIGETKSVFVLPGKDNPAATLPTNASESASPSAIIE